MPSIKVRKLDKGKYRVLTVVKGVRKTRDVSGTALKRSARERADGANKKYVLIR